MSLYDTEDLMQQGALILGSSSMFLSIEEIDPAAIKAACQVIKEQEPAHYKTADFYSRKAGNGFKTRLDKILGVDDVLEVEIQEGKFVKLAVDWTDNPLELCPKAGRFKTRSKMLQTLGCQYALAVCVSNQIKLKTQREKLNFMYQALSLIMEKTESMAQGSKKVGYLEINMKALMTE